jgi:hypothetical protein
MPPELLDKMEALYAPPDHLVFKLVPLASHEHISNIYSAIGQPEVTVDTFWDIFHNLLGHLHEGLDEHLAEIIIHYKTHGQELDDMFLLPNMDTFCLGQPLNLGANSNYIGGLDGFVITNSTEL